jgi:hypothetical protein
MTIIDDTTANNAVLTRIQRSFRDAMCDHTFIVIATAVLRVDPTPDRVLANPWPRDTQ